MSTPSGPSVASEHVPLDLSLPWNEGELPQCWTCGLPWLTIGACSGVPTDEQVATMLDDPSTWAEGLAHEVRRLRVSDWYDRAAQAGFDRGRDAREQGEHAEDQVYLAVIAALDAVLANDGEAAR